MEDATSTVYSGLFVEEEGTLSSLRGVRETIEAKGRFSSLYSDRGSHYCFTPEPDSQRLAQGRLLAAVQRHVRRAGALPLMGIDKRGIRCTEEQPTVRSDNCVTYDA
jgi:hypothetical protein